MKAVVAIIVVVVLAVGGFALFHKSKPAPANTTNNTNSSTSNNNAPSSSNTNNVTISDMTFSPSSITVKKGTKVTWTNNDSTTHTVTADSNDGPKSGDVAPGQSYSFTFDKAGTFNYHCSIHPNMTGSVTVTE